MVDVNMSSDDYRREADTEARLLSGELSECRVCETIYSTDYDDYGLCQNCISSQEVTGDGGGIGSHEDRERMEKYAGLK